MSEVSPTGKEVELGMLLALLHGAADSFRTVQATYRTWSHHERSRRAFRADSEEQKRSGASITSMVFRRISDPEPEPPMTEETVRIWRDGQRLREERHGGRRDGHYGVADGPLWWFWDEGMGAMSNQDDPSVGSGVGQELQVMLNPIPLLSALRFRVAGRSQVAGRATVTAHATARPEDPRHGRLLALHQLGAGAHRYELEVDQERGALLAVTSIHDDLPFFKITTLAIGFDQPIPAEIFQFAPPEGEQIQSTRDRHRHLLHHITLTEAQQRAPFTVFMPDHVPTDWQVNCVFIEPSQRPPSKAHVSLTYRSADGHQSVSISQMAAADHYYEIMINDENWQEVARDGTSVKVRPAEWAQAEAHLERDGTLVFLASDNLTSDQLATIAASLRPAPNTGSI
jgi:hypothetical protein